MIKFNPNSDLRVLLYRENTSNKINFSTEYYDTMVIYSVLSRKYSKIGFSIDTSIPNSNRILISQYNVYPVESFLDTISSNANLPVISIGIDLPLEYKKNLLNLFYNEEIITNIRRECIDLFTNKNLIEQYQETGFTDNNQQELIKRLFMISLYIILENLSKDFSAIRYGLIQDFINDIDRRSGVIESFIDLVSAKKDIYYTLSLDNPREELLAKQTPLYKLATFVSKNQQQDLTSRDRIANMNSYIDLLFNTYIENNDRIGNNFLTSTSCTNIPRSLLDIFSSIHDNQLMRITKDNVDLINVFLALAAAHRDSSIYDYIYEIKSKINIEVSSPTSAGYTTKELNGVFYLLARNLSPSETEVINLLMYQPKTGLSEITSITTKGSLDEVIRKILIPSRYVKLAPYIKDIDINLKALKIDGKAEPKLCYLETPQAQVSGKTSLISFNLESEEKITSLTETVDILNEAATTNKQLRTKIENLIYKYMNAVDKTKTNSKHMYQIFKNMNDNQFMKYIKNICQSEDQNFYMEFLPGKNQPLLEDVLDGLNVLKVPKDEYVWFRDGLNKDNPVRTRYKHPVGYITVKRMQHMLSKKNTYGMDIDKRNQLTGGLTQHDSVAKISDMESIALEALGGENILKELLGPRADSVDAKNQLYNDINMYGYARLNGLPNGVENKQALRNTALFFLGAGITSDLMEQPDDLKITVAKI